MSNLRRIPMNPAKRRRLAAAGRRVNCEVSGRTLRFPESALWVDGTHMMRVDVVASDQTEGERVLCHMVVSKEALMRALSSVRNVRQNGNPD